MIKPVVIRAINEVIEMLGESAVKSLEVVAVVKKGEADVAAIADDEYKSPAPTVVKTRIAIMLFYDSWLGRRRDFNLAQGRVIHPG